MAVILPYLTWHRVHELVSAWLSNVCPEWATYMNSLLEWPLSIIRLWYTQISSLWSIALDWIHRPELDNRHDKYPNIRVLLNSTSNNHLIHPILLYYLTYLQGTHWVPLWVHWTREVRLCGGQQPFRVSSHEDLECTVLYVLYFYWQTVILIESTFSMEIALIIH